MEQKLNFGWGDTPGIRECFSAIYGNNHLDNRTNGVFLNDLCYPPMNGIDDFNRAVCNLIKLLTGLNYKYIIPTSGCTHAVNSAVIAISQVYGKMPVTFEAPYYLLYPHMMKTIGFDTVSCNEIQNKIFLIDSPSNPLGIIGIRKYNVGSQDKIIWDAAYHSPTYNVKLGYSDWNLATRSDVFCGSFSKLTGLNGFRIGWAATNCPVLYDTIKHIVKYSICGVSIVLQKKAVYMLSNTDKLKKFFNVSRQVVEQNKDEVSRLSILFGNQKMPEYGMFVFWEADKKLFELFKNAGIEVVSGKDCGMDDHYMRISLGQKNATTKYAVDKILKIDRRGS